MGGREISRRRRPPRGWPLLLGACLLGACEQAPGGRPGADTAAAASSSGLAGPGASGAASLSPALRAQWAELVGRQLPSTFADADERRFYASCLEFTRALHERAAELEEQRESQSRDPAEPPALLRAVEAVQEAPPRMPKQDVAWCAAYTIKSLQAELGRAVARQAETTLQAMAGAMVVAHDKTGKLCPSTTEPVPPRLEQVAKGPFQPDPQAWEAPTWRCLHFRWLRPLRFQYELQVEADRFEFIARGSPAADGRVDEYRLAGRARDGKLELGSVTGRFLAEPAAADPR